MPTPPKPVLVIQQEQKSHRTKAEIEKRRQAEEALTTGIHMREWWETKTDPAAHKEFVRIRNLLRKIGKDDGLHENVINRYALMHSECQNIEQMQKRLRIDVEATEHAYNDGDIEFTVYMQLVQKINANLAAMDRQLQAKRKMLLDIEKENIMTIASTLRTIPKKAEKKTESGMSGFLGKRRDSG